MNRKYIINNLIMSAVVAVISTVTCIIYDCVYCVSNDTTGWLTYVYLFLAVFGFACIFWIIAGLVFETHDPDEDFQPDPSVVYFYHEYVNGIAMVDIVSRRYDNDPNPYIQCSYINEQGDFITDMTFDGGANFTEPECAFVMKDGKVNLISRDGKILCREWFAGAMEFTDHKAKVVNDDGLVNYVKVDGSLCWSHWKPELDVQEVKSLH